MCTCNCGSQMHICGCTYYVGLAITKNADRICLFVSCGAILSLDNLYMQKSRSRPNLDFGGHKCNIILWVAFWCWTKSREYALLWCVCVFRRPMQRDVLYSNSIYVWRLETDRITHWMRNIHMWCEQPPTDTTGGKSTNQIVRAYK